MFHSKNKINKYTKISSQYKKKIWWEKNSVTFCEQMIYFINDSIYLSFVCIFYKIFDKSIQLKKSYESLYYSNLDSVNLFFPSVLFKMTFPDSRKSCYNIKCNEKIFLFKNNFKYMEYKQHGIPDKSFYLFIFFIYFNTNKKISFCEYKLVSFVIDYKTVNFL